MPRLVPQFGRLEICLGIQVGAPWGTQVKTIENPGESSENHGKN